MAATVNSSITLQHGFDYENPSIGQGIPNAVFNGNLGVKASFQSTIADAVLNGASIEYGPTLTVIAATGNFTPSLAAMTDPLGAAINFFRVKAILVELLNATQDAVNGTAAASVLVGNAASNQALTGTPGFLGSAASTFRVYNGGFALFSAGNAAGVTVGALVNLKILNEDGALPAALRLTIYGGKT